MAAESGTSTPIPTPCAHNAASPKKKAHHLRIWTKISTPAHPGYLINQGKDTASPTARQNGTILKSFEGAPMAVWRLAYVNFLLPLAPI